MTQLEELKQENELETEKSTDVFIESNNATNPSSKE